ncbi:ABC transporter permease [Gemella sp. zg-570]|uniref:ABC transporter permease n=1 Tax=Gemella sp. zg-570 TaxID=2840371 RepID=UPI001C0C0E2B|nr:ABC transporter permease [Gemella sp. zg-570]QWQ38397.1 ABC transporter permease [Gemella sp. zg-570]
MGNIKEILRLRIKKENEKRASYRKYIFNSHLVMFLLILIGAIMFNYSNWLNKASNFELYSVLFSLQFLMAYLLTTLKVKTYIREADSIFILPQEINYKKIINKLISGTIITKLFISIFFISVSYPIINKLEFSIFSFLSYFLSIFITIIFFTIYKYYKVFYDNLDMKDMLIMFFVYIFIVINFLILPKVNFIFILAILIFYNYKKNMSNNINWYGAAEYDKIRNENYLKFINMFVDVPINTTKVSRRKYLDILLPKLSNNNFSRENTYRYYYIRAFLRQENTVFLIIRLLALAIIFVISFKNVYVSAVIIILFNYLAVIQLIPSYKRLNELIWSYILPVDEEIKYKSFKELIYKYLLVSSCILLFIALVINFNFLNLVILFIATIMASLINTYFLSKSV